MQPVTTVVVQVVQVTERRLGPVVVGQVQLPHLGGDHSLGGGGQRGVPDRARLVVGEVASLVLSAEGIAPQVHGQHQVGLLDDLLAVDLEVGKVQEQRVRRARRPLEVPLRVVGEARGLRVHPDAFVVRLHHCVGSADPQRDLLVADVEAFGDARLALGGRSGRPEVALRHQVREDVVVDDRGVLVRPSHSGDPEPLLAVEVTQGGPEPAGLDEQLGAARFIEVDVAGGVQVPDGGVGDVCVEVERGGTGRPVARALLAMDRPPGERRPGLSEHPRPLPGHVQNGVPPPQRVPDGVGRGIGQHRQHERLAVPERVTVVTGTGQALGGDRLLLGPYAGLQHVEHGHPHRLLQLRIAVDLDIGVAPVLV